MRNHPTTIRFVPFNQLTPHEVYAILAARSRVFVVEQQCVYDDMDGHDFHAVHAILSNTNSDSANDFVAYARILSPGSTFEEPSIGRILTTQAYRQKGFGRQIVRQSIEYCHREFPGSPIRIAAQKYLSAFYAEFGFEPAGACYDEDGIPHVPMLLAASSSRLAKSNEKPQSA